MAEERKGIEEARKKLGDAKETLERIREEGIIELERAEERLLEAYFNRIIENYEVPENRETILRGLEYLAEKGRKKYFAESSMSKFDGQKARETRENAGFKLRELAGIIGMDQGQLSSVETGKQNVGYPPKGRVKILVEWLADNGYDPYGILEED